MSNEYFGRVALVVSLLFGVTIVIVMIAYETGKNSLMSDCNDMGMFSVRGQVYECTKINK